MKTENKTTGFKYEANNIACREQVKWLEPGSRFTTLLTVDRSGEKTEIKFPAFLVRVRVTKAMDEKGEEMAAASFVPTDAALYEGEIDAIYDDDYQSFIGENVTVPVEAIIFCDDICG